MRRLTLLLLFALAACNQSNGVHKAAAPELPEADEDIVAFAASTTVDDLLPAIDRGLLSRGKAAIASKQSAEGLDSVWFVVIRAGDRHGADFRARGFHAVVGAGVNYPAGALLVRRDWGTSGMVDGRNEQPEAYGIAVAVEPGAARPYAPEVRAAVTKFVAALTSRRPIHPDCVLAMQEIPHTREHEADVDERALASAARANLAPPPAAGTLTIQTEDGPRTVTFEHRSTTAGIKVGMMMRRGFDGTNRGMLFEYAHRGYRRFWMKNCPIRMDLAYIREGRIEQLESMEPGFGVAHDDIPGYPSRAAVKFALEMPEGWFAQNGVKVGDNVQFE